jgi:hypothetical protein
VINAQDIIKKIEPLVKGQHPADVVGALLSAAVTLVQLVSNHTEEDFIERAREIWRAYDDERKKGSS